MRLLIELPLDKHDTNIEYKLHKAIAQIVVNIEILHSSIAELIHEPSFHQDLSSLQKLATYINNIDDADKPSALEAFLEKLETQPASDSDSLEMLNV